LRPLNFIGKTLRNLFRLINQINATNLMRTYEVNVIVDLQNGCYL
jgi:hypothetical protein